MKLTKHTHACLELEHLGKKAFIDPGFFTEDVSSTKDTAVYHGDLYEVDGFKFEFFGDMHQIIHESIPLIQNTGVMVNGLLYYPGDSYTTPDQEVKVLACPTSAPWLKIGDVMDFIAEVKPKQCFATHNALLSDLGHELNNSRVKLVTEQFGGSFTYLDVGESLSV
jgi:hypothetical protein